MVIDFVTNYEITIQAPTPEPGEESFPEFVRGTEIEVKVPFPDGIRIFSSLIRRVDSSWGGALHLAWPDGGVRVQRRDFVRVDVSRPARAWFHDPDTEKLRQLTGSTVDLSAGGVRLRLAEAIPDDLPVELELDLPDLTAPTMRGRVVRSGVIEKAGKPDAFWVAIEFVDVGESLRNKLTQYIFDIQRERKRKSLP